MTLEIRRVVTGHDENGKAVVTIDEVTKNVRSNRPGANSTVIWATDDYPPDMANLRDISADVATTTVDNGTVFRVLRLDPGSAPRMHRTASIDYAVVMEGEIDMELDDGVVVHLRQGDTLVQNGTIHNWRNNGKAPCTIAFVLIHAAMPDGIEAHG